MRAGEIPALPIMNTITLHFIANYGMYTKGDVASFPPTAAKIMLDCGAAIKFIEPDIKRPSGASVTRGAKSKMMKK